MDPKEVKKALLIDSDDEISSDCLNSGSTLINLACTGRIYAAYPMGSYVLSIGDSSAGKTWTAMAAFAEASIDPKFDEHRFIYDGPEDGAKMNIKRYFGERMAKRLEAPAYDDDVPIASSTVEEMYYNIHDAIEGDKPFIYVMDSMDCLSSDAEVQKFDERKKANRLGKTTTGSFGASKAKSNSEHLRRVVSAIKGTESILILLVQTRDSFDMFQSRTHGGGRSLKFYSTLEIWSRVKNRLKRGYKGKDRQYGIESMFDIKKSRITGKERSVIVPILHSVGIDDIGSCVDFLTSEKAWGKNKVGTIVVSGIGLEMTGKREAIVNEIEERGLEDDLRGLVGETWEKIEDAISVTRKKRY